MRARPNILFVMTDHTNAQALAPGSQCLTPHLDALAAQGTRFEHCYTPNAICSPARASLMTGLYPSTHGMWDCTHTQRREWLDIPPDRFTHFSRILADAGYRNAYFGKWHVEQSNQLERFGWHEYDLGCAHARPRRLPGTEVIVPKAGYRDYLLAAVSEDDALPSHPAFDRGIDFIHRHASAQHGDRPFCCFISTSEPHDPYIPPKRFFERYDLPRIRVSPTLRDDPAGKPEIVRRMRAVWEGLSETDWQRITAAYWASITFLDHEVGRLLRALRETRQDENTIIVFTSDHGDMLGGHGLATKGIGTPYEEVYNIPLIMRVPGMAGPNPATRTAATPDPTRHARVSTVDLGPTLLDLCGAPALPGAQGRSIRPLLDGKWNPEEWDEAYAEFYGQRFVYTQRIVWHGDWKYIFSPGGTDELYHLGDDPHERHNLAEDPAFREPLHAMAKRMWRKMRAIGDESLLKTEYATLRIAPVGPGD